MATAYELLGVPRDASSDEVRTPSSSQARASRSRSPLTARVAPAQLRRAYHRLAREQHPDRAAGSLSRAASVDFVALQEAWEAVRPHRSGHGTTRVPCRKARRFC